MNTYTQTVINTYQSHANPGRASQQKAYMKGHFDFFGITAPERKILNRTLFKKAHLPTKQEAFTVIKELWAQPQRELQYFAMELAEKYLKQPAIEDIDLYAYMITHKSWWDSVDFIAGTLVGGYFRVFRFERDPVVTEWLASGNIWLQRTCLLFQLKYKAQTDTLLLYRAVYRLLGTKEFFINKAIGWALREYSKTNPVWVQEVVEELDELSNLSRREALKIIEKYRLADEK
ncbi:MAG: DNA alkylation repair protein [Flavobacteriia bacterium]|nr:MAG: DNA alkylation repair protein [Flavobacteriia bacterium]